jgi:hypothetical protein
MAATGIPDKPGRLAALARWVGASGRGVDVTVAAGEAKRGWRFLENADQPQTRPFAFGDGSARPVFCLSRIAR